MKTIYHLSEHEIEQILENAIIRDCAHEGPFARFAPQGSDIKIKLDVQPGQSITATITKEPRKCMEKPSPVPNVGV